MVLYLFWWIWWEVQTFPLLHVWRFWVFLSWSPKKAPTGPIFYTFEFLKIWRKITLCPGNSHFSYLYFILKIFFYKETWMRKNFIFVYYYCWKTQRWKFLFFFSFSVFAIFPIFPTSYRRFFPWGKRGAVGGGTLSWYILQLSAGPPLLISTLPRLKEFYPALWPTH